MILKGCLYLAGLVAAVSVAGCGAGPDRDSGAGGQPGEGGEGSGQPVTLIVQVESAADPDRLDAEIAQPLAEPLMKLPDVAEVRSRSGAGLVRLEIELRSGAEAQDARLAVADAIRAVADRLPADCGPPELPAHDPESDPLLWVALSSETRPLDELGRIGAQLRERLQMIPHVAEVRMVGSPERRVEIELDPERLAATGLDVRDVLEAVRAATTENRPLADASKVAQDLELLPIGPVDGGPTRLRDVARVQLGVQQESVAVLDGRPIVALGVWHDQMAATGQAEIVNDEAGEVRRVIEAQRADLPADVVSEIAIDRTSKERAVLVAEVDRGAGDAWSSPENTEHIAGLIEKSRESSRNPAAPLRSLYVTGEAAHPSDLRMYIECDNAEWAVSLGLGLLRGLNGNPPGVQVRVRDASAQRGESRERHIAMSLLGPEMDLLSRWCDDVVAQLSALDSLANLNSSAQLVTMMRAEVDTDRAAVLGVSAEELDVLVQDLMGRRAIGELAADGGPLPFYVSVGNGRTPDELLGRVQVVGSDGALIPLASVVRLVEIAMPEYIERRNGRACVRIRADLPDSVAVEDALRECREVAEKTHAELGLSAEYTVDVD